MLTSDGIHRIYLENYDFLVFNLFYQFQRLSHYVLWFDKSILPAVCVVYLDWRQQRHRASAKVVTSRISTPKAAPTIIGK